MAHVLPNRPHDAVLEEHAICNRLFARQAELLPGRVTPEFLAGLDMLRLSPPGIPSGEELSDRPARLPATVAAASAPHFPAER